MRELTFNITEDKRYLVEPTNVENFNLTFDKPNWVQGRVGEDSLRQVFVNVVTGPNNEPYDLTGINPEFDGLTPKGGEDNRNYVVIDNHHSVMIDAQGGRFRFDFPREAFAIAGSYKQAFFSLKREGTGEVVATLEFDMKVMANFVYETVKAVDYITPFDDVLDQLLEKYKQGNADREEQFNQFITNIQSQYNSIKSQFEASESLADALDERVKALESKIEQDGLFTTGEADEFKAAINSSLNSLTQQTEEAVGKINQSIFYDSESKATFDYVNHSHTYLVTVNKRDAGGTLIMPRVESITSMNAAGPHSYARHSLSTVTINAGLTIPVDKSTGDFTTTAGNNWQWTQAIIISHGQVLSDLDAHTAKTLPDHYEYLAIKSDGSLVGYKANSTTALQMINEGVTEAFLTFWRIMDNGAKVSSDTFVDMTSGSTNTGVKYPCILFGEFQDGTYGFLACDGRTSIDFGMDYVQWQDYAASLGFKNAWNIDGGGSASLNYKGSKLNKAVDTNNLGAVVDRLIGYVLTINKPGVEPTQADRAFIRSAEVKDELIQSRQIEKDWIKKVGVIGHSAVEITTDDDFTNYMNDRIDEALAYPAMDRGSVIVGKMFLANQLVPQWFPSLSPHKSSRFLWTLTTPPYGQDSTAFPPDHPSRFISLELKSLSNPSEIYYRRFDMRTHTWGSWVERGVPMALNLTVTVSNSIVSDVSGSISADGTVIIRGTVYQAIGNTWTKIITGAPIGRFDGNHNPIYAYPTAFAGGSLRLFVDNSTGDVYARYNWDGAGRDASMGFTISYHSGQLFVSDQTYVSQ